MVREVRIDRALKQYHKTVAPIVATEHEHMTIDEMMDNWVAYSEANYKVAVENNLSPDEVTVALIFEEVSMYDKEYWAEQDLDLGEHHWGYNQ